MFFGICLALAANALWALGFLVPYVTGTVPGADFVFLRYSCYGAVAGILILTLAHQKTRLGCRHILKAVGLGAIGYALSFLCTFFAVKLIGGVLAALLIGLVPVIFPIGANFRERTIPWPPLLVAAGAILLGLIVLQADNLRGLADVGNGWTTTLGVVCALLAMASWGVFVLNNEVSGPTGLLPVQEGRLWVAWIGVGSLAGSFVILLPFLLLGQSRLSDLPALAAQDWRPFALAAFMGLFSTWASTWLWREALRRLSPAMATQLAASETLFAVAYALVYERTMPGIGVVGGTVLIVGGVMLTSATPFLVERLRQKRAALIRSG